MQKKCTWPLLALVMVSLWLSPAIAADAPEAVVPNAVFQFDPVVEGMMVTHDFVIQNKGQAELNITKVRTG